MIYHVFPGTCVNHVPYMIEFFERFAPEIGISRGEQIYYMYDVSKRNQPAYRRLAVPSERLILRKSRRIRSSLWRRLKKDDFLFLHSAFAAKLWRQLLLRPRIRRNTALFFWGAEIKPLREQGQERQKSFGARLGSYLADAGPRPLWKRVLRPLLSIWFVSRQSVSNRIDFFARNRVLPELGAICTWTRGEFQLIDKWHGPCRNHFPIVFHHCTAEFELSPGRKTSGELKVLLGNSGAISNEHLEALSWLEKFRRENLRVICPLSFPGYSPYIREVIETGKRRLGEKFVPLLEVIPKAEYDEFLKSIDVHIQNAGRQQGLYCVYACLRSGAKVYLSPASPSFDMMRERGIEIFDIEEIRSSSFQEFIAFSRESREKNRELAEKYFSLLASVRSMRGLMDKMKAGAGIPARLG